jgi:hypothetical protein
MFAAMALAASVAGFFAASAYAAQAAPPGAGGDATAQRFPVVHLHVGTWCMGYLYVSADGGVRYEVVRPEKDKRHSFQLQRSEMKALQLWNLMGQIQNIVEIKAAHANYHFYLLQSEADLDPAQRWSIDKAAPATTLLSAISNPGSAAAQASGAASPTAPADAASAPPAYPAAADAGGAAQALAPPAQTPPDASQPSAAPPPAVAPADSPDPLPSGALEGLYVGFSIHNARMENRFLLFTRDGWVFRDFPDEGLAGFNATAFRNDPSRNKSWTGRYRLDGNDIHILWQDSADDREILHLNEKGASEGLNTFIPVCRCTGTRFSGVYIWGLPAQGQYLQFFPDGTFLDHGTTDQLFEPSPYYDRPRILRGTYAIQDQALIFNFADGRRMKRIFMAPRAQKHKGRFDWINLGIHRLFERNYQPQP